MNTRIGASILPKAALKGKIGIKLSETLLLNEEESIKKIFSIEHSDEFQMLVSLKVVSRKPIFGYKNLVTYELKDDIVPTLSDYIELDKFVNKNLDVIHLIKKIGEEKYKKYFLDYECYSFEDIAQNTGLSINEVKQVFSFTNEVLISNIFYSEIIKLQYPQEYKKYIRIAEVKFFGKKVVVLWLTPSILRGQYKIDYGKLNKILRSLSCSQRKKIKEVVNQLELYNIRASVLYRIVETLCDFQKEFLLTGKLNKLRVITQKKLSEIIGISPSVVCRAIKEKTILAPSGEYKLSELLMNRKEFIMVIIEDIIAKNKTLTDKQLCEVLKQKTGVQLSRRTVNYYRNLLLLRSSRQK
ncbi:MAG: hypothetical protein N2643_01110 [Endomicrobia bacterium]|nr:hypothetical protein [Endomicrobiia bacterium]